MAAASAAGGPIRFGTSGWRGTLGDEITDVRVRALVRATARVWRAAGSRRRVLVAFDTRFASERLARLACEELRLESFRAQLVAAPCPTPLLSSALTRGRCAGGLMFTASHNPPDDHGVKVFSAAGCLADATVSRAIEREATRTLRETGRESGQADRAAPTKSPPAVDVATAYEERLREVLDLRWLRRRRPLVVYDALHGVGAGVLPLLLEGCGLRVHGLRLAADPRFGGIAPDPTPARLAELGREVRRVGAVCGIATDGDADRFGVVDEQGRALSEARAAALLVEAVSERGAAGSGVALTRATGSLVAEVGEAHGLVVLRERLGFKWLSRALLEGRAGVACDESCGFAWGNLGFDKDGVSASALMVELASRGPLSRRVRALERRHGRFHCGREARPRGERAEAALERLRAHPPGRLGRAGVAAVDTKEGLYLRFADGFGMLRSSGTEPLLRAYAEAPTGTGLRQRFAALWRLIGARTA